MILRWPPTTKPGATTAAARRRSSALPCAPCAACSSAEPAPRACWRWTGPTAALLRPTTRTTSAPRTTRIRSSVTTAATSVTAIVRQTTSPAHGPRDWPPPRISRQLG
ncbi:hypothetical protein G6F66_015343 [Rhizopus arrhizus]|nr:hypothetical protein G6F66_015343 [Rhizopus arrhizus]